jgi:hypothetical protein
MVIRFQEHLVSGFLLIKIYGACVTSFIIVRCIPQCHQFRFNVFCLLRVDVFIVIGVTDVLVFLLKVRNRLQKNRHMVFASDLQLFLEFLPRPSLFLGFLLTIERTSRQKWQASSVLPDVLAKIFHNFSLNIPGVARCHCFTYNAW